jgi:serine/threonine-protein kinase
VGIQIGESIGGYVVEAMLGQGGMGSVYRVRNLITDRHDALKVLVSDVNAMPHVVERFMREIKVQASLSHPNIASLHTALRHGNQLLMVMELVEGHTLEERMRPGVPLGPTAVAWIVQLLSALNYAHARGIVHRDIKPANIMISHTGLVKLLDFGIASRGDVEMRLTATGAPIGTLYYMSPEQIRTLPIDGRSDIYSTGVVLYEALTGRRPIEGDNAYDCMQAHLNKKPVSPYAINQSIPPALSNAVMQALEKDPSRRFQSAADFENVLSGVLRTLHSISLTASMVMPQTPPVADRIPSRTTANRSVTPVPEGWDPMVIEKARQDLAQFIGPMAKVLVKSALREANTVGKLYELLALEIADEKDRKKFLALRPRTM